MCGGNEVLAEYVFEMVDWVHPEAFIEADLAGIGVFPCASCKYFYDHDNYDHCPKCGKPQ